MQGTYETVNPDNAFVMIEKASAKMWRASRALNFPGHLFIPFGSEALKSSYFCRSMLQIQ
jgi:hypothetical protein